MPSWPLRSMRERRSRLVRKLQGLQTENDGVLERIQAAHGEEASQQNPRPGGAATTSGATAHRRSRAHVCSADAPPGPTPSLLQQHGPPRPRPRAAATSSSTGGSGRRGGGGLGENDEVAPSAPPADLTLHPLCTFIMILYGYIMHVCILACMQACQYAVCVKYACKYAYA
jgi:hypothetical protein